MVDLLLADLAQMEYKERLQQAERFRAMQSVQGNEAGFGKNLLLNLSHWLIGTGEQLRQRAEMRPSMR